jgi:hypothetical protein
MPAPSMMNSTAASSTRRSSSSICACVSCWRDASGIVSTASRPSSCTGVAAIKYSSPPARSRPTYDGRPSMKIAR